MNNSKTPVSLLQEAVVRCNLPSPNYAYESAEGAFRCTATVGSVSAEGRGHTKQSAKHESAFNLLKKLNLIKEDVKGVAPSSNDKHEVFVNYVGQLNELTVARKLPFPSFKDDGFTVKGEFIVQCSLCNVESLGVALTKKQAKQRAACNLLRSLRNKDVMESVEKLVNNASVIPVARNKNVLDEIDDSIILKKYKELSLYAENNKTKVDGLIPVKDEQPTVPVEISAAKVDSLSEVQELEDLCRKLNFSYKIEVLDKYRNILILKETKTNITEIGKGDTHDAAKAMVLKRFLKLKSVS